MKEFSTSIWIDDLEQRLAPRRAAEKLHHKGHTIRGRGNLMLRLEHLVVPAVKGALVAAGLYSRGLANALDLVVRHVRFEFPGLPPGLDGFRILHLSDLHIDGQDAMAELLAERLDGVSADLCVLTGDYRFEIEGPCGDVYPRMRTILSAVRARHGVLAILGNHDEADMAAELAEMGARMLINDAVEIRDGLWAVGADDGHCYGLDDLSAPLECVPEGAFRLLLAHTPELYEEAAARGIDLYLCGHTHAGQLCLPFLGPVLLNAVCPRSYASGRWRHGGTQGYTTAGIGCSLLPVRYNCPPEIAVIELAAGGDA